MPTLHAAALCLLVKMMRRGSDNVTAVAGACRVAVRTGSRHCCVGIPAAALRLQCRVKLRPLCL